MHKTFTACRHHNRVRRNRVSISGKICELGVCKGRDAAHVAVDSSRSTELDRLVVRYDLSCCENDAVPGNRECRIEPSKSAPQPRSSRAEGNTSRVIPGVEACQLVGHKGHAERPPAPHDAHLEGTNPSQGAGTTTEPSSFAA